MPGPEKNHRPKQLNVQQKKLKTMRKMKIKNFLMLILLLAAQTVWSQTAGDTLLTLEQALSIALQNNHDIRIAENDLQKSKNNATPGNVGLFPSLSLQGNY